MKVDLLNHTIFGRYKVNKLIGRGSFSSIFQGKNITNNELVAIKTESIKSPIKFLESEAYFLFYLKNFGIPEIKSFGTYRQWAILVETLLGDDLSKLFKKFKKINMKDIYMIFIQLIERLEYIHSKYIVHRDLKPENIMLDLETKKIIYLIDFGLAKKYRSGKTKKHIKYGIVYNKAGTERYSSLNTMNGIEQSRRDDLESAGYVMIYLSQKNILPWIATKMKNADERFTYIFKTKKETSVEKLCQNLPKAFCDYMKYVKKLRFEEEPNYNYLKGLFIDSLISLGMKNDLGFSWISKNDTKFKLIKLTKEKPLVKRKVSFKTRLLKKIESIEKEKIIHNSENGMNKTINFLDKDNKEEPKIQIKKINKKLMLNNLDENNINHDNINNKNVQTSRTNKYNINQLRNKNSDNLVINKNKKLELKKNKNKLINISNNNINNNSINLREIYHDNYKSLRTIDSSNNKHVIINKNKLINISNNNINNNTITLSEISPDNYKNTRTINSNNNKHIIINKNNTLKNNNINNFIDKKSNNPIPSAKYFSSSEILNTLPLTRKNINYERKMISINNNGNENSFFAERNNKIFNGSNTIKTKLLKKRDDKNNILKMNFNTINVGIFNPNYDKNSFYNIYKDKSYFA